MSKIVAVQMDPVESIDIDGDSSFVMSLEAQKRGYQLYHYQPDDLAFESGQLFARACPMTLRREKGNHVSKGAAERINLGEVDVVLMRQDPPFDMGYITATHLLEHIHPKTLVVNNPTEVRNAPEKIFITQFGELMPETLITRDPEAIKDFRARYKDIIVKPLYGNGGAGVFRVQPEDQNLSALLELFGGINREPLMIQRYLPEINEGDKRVILIDGKPVGAINRIAAKGEVRSNMHVGGRAEKIDLSKRDMEICEAIGPTLKEKGLIFVGIDVIGDYLTEINVTSPTGIQETDRFNGTDISTEIWDAIESRL